MVWKTRTGFAAEMGISKNLVTQWLKGRQRITSDYEKQLRKLKPPYDGPLPDEKDKPLTAAEFAEGLKTILDRLNALGAADAAILVKLQELQGNGKG